MCYVYSSWGDIGKMVRAVDIVFEKWLVDSVMFVGKIFFFFFNIVFFFI